MTENTTTYLKPLPIPDSLTAPFWEAAHEGRLLVQRCSACGAHQHYPRPYCIKCFAESPEWVQASGRGEVHTFTVTYRNDAPGFAEEAPYVFAIVETEEGVRMPGNVIDIDPESVVIGMGVQVTFVPATPELSIPQWRPV
jgi:uncharacterized OB-fold protein